MTDEWTENVKAIAKQAIQEHMANNSQAGIDDDDLAIIGATAVTHHPRFVAAQEAFDEICRQRGPGPLDFWKPMGDALDDAVAAAIQEVRAENTQH